jgi:hypothetical protein
MPGLAAIPSTAVLPTWLIPPVIHDPGAASIRLRRWRRFTKGDRTRRGGSVRHASWVLIRSGSDQPAHIAFATYVGLPAPVG